MFLAQATNTPLSIGDLSLVLAVSLVTSKGAHGVPGSAIVIIAATLNAVPSIPAGWYWSFGRLVHRHGACGRQLDRQLRRHSRCRRLRKEINLPLAEHVLDSDVVIEAMAA